MPSKAASMQRVRKAMRFHKSRKIRAVDAELIMTTRTSSLGGHVVISHNQDWYDVRAMTDSELQEFVDDLIRAELAATQSGRNAPH
jgi:hypothetical protein